MNLLDEDATIDIRIAPGSEPAPLHARLFARDDAPRIAAAVRSSLHELGRWMPWATADYDTQAAQAFVEMALARRAAGSAYEFGVFDRAGRLMGSVGLNALDPDNRRCNLGYWIASPFTGRGIATRGARAVAEFGFLTLDLARIEIVAAVGNTASRRTALRAGARFEGIARNRLRIRGMAHDCAVHGLVPEDLGVAPGSTRRAGERSARGAQGLSARTPGRQG